MSVFEIHNSYFSRLRTFISWTFPKVPSGSRVLGFSDIQQQIKTPKNFFAKKRNFFIVGVFTLKFCPLPR